VLYFEKWKKINNAIWDCYISSFGRIKRIFTNEVGSKTEYLVYQYTDIGGYKRAELGFKNRKKTMVHRIVAEAFIRNPKHKPHVNHKKGIKKDNRMSELEWVTPRENLLHSYHVLKNPHPRGMLGKTGALNKKCKKIKWIETGEIFACAKDAAIKTGANSKSIKNVCLGNISNIKGLHFIYL
jgi:hypothetical protein